MKNCFLLFYILFMEHFTLSSKKRTLAFFASIILLLAFSGCGMEKEHNSDGQKAEIDAIKNQISQITESLQESSNGSISNEAIESAVAKYFEENKSQFENEKTDAEVKAAVDKLMGEDKAVFGKLVVESANAYQMQEQAAEEAKKADLVKNVPSIRESDHVLGDKDAQFVLYEYSDFQCPFCQRFHPTSKEFIENNKDVALVFRSMPLDQLHPKARGVHEVAECVADLGGNDAFWKFADSVFNQEVTSNEDYQAAAKKAGISDDKALAECITSKKHVATVQDSLLEGESLGIQGTPTSILKNMKTGEVELIGGAYPLDALEAALAKLK